MPTVTERLALSLWKTTAVRTIQDSVEAFHQEATVEVSPLAHLLQLAEATFAAQPLQYLNASAQTLLHQAWEEELSNESSIPGMK